MATNLTLRSVKGTPLTVAEGDENFTNLRDTADAKSQATAIGIAATAENLGTFTGTTIADGATVKTALQSLETATETVTATAATKANASALGVAASAADMGTFTGATILDTQTAKQALQALETAFEAEPTATRTLTGKTVNLTSNTLSGTTVQFNAALSDGDFATLAGAETLASKTLSSMNGGALAGLRNRAINGAMRVDQRNAGASQTFTAAAALAYCVDRFYGYCTGANITGQRVALANGQNRYRFTGAASNTAVGFGHRIEATNSLDLAGSTATLSVKLSSSSLTSITWTAYYANTADTFGTLAAPTRTQIATGTFTINSTEATYSTNISVPSAAITGVEIVLTGGALLGTQTLTIGDVQLEVGTAVTPLERIPYGQDFALCQRYYAPVGAGWSGMEESATSFSMAFQYPCIMRTTPTLSLISSSVSTRLPATAADRTITGAAISSPAPTALGAWVLFSNTSGNVAGRFIQDRGGINVVTASAEL